ncbi:MAG: RNA-binding S4 domain-containing protein [Sphingobium sp.]
MADRASAPIAGPSLRIDKFLWFARLANSRSVAQKMAQDGHIRLNGRRIERSHTPVRAGDLITFPYPGQHPTCVRVVRVMQLPDRRGPAVEAQACYDELRVGG